MATAVITGERSVDDVVRVRFLARGRTEDANLSYAEARLGDRHDTAAADRARQMLQLYRKLLGGATDASGSQGGSAVVADPEDSVQLALRLAGMAAERDRPDGARVLAVRNRVFREVFDAGWARRQDAGRAIAAPLAVWLDSGCDDAYAVTGTAQRRVSLPAGSATLPWDGDTTFGNDGKTIWFYHSVAAHRSSDMLPGPRIDVPAQCFYDVHDLNAPRDRPLRTLADAGGAWAELSAGCGLRALLPLDGGRVAAVRALGATELTVAIFDGTP